MKEQYQKIWDLALPYLEKGIKKNFVVHTKCVIEAMELLLKEEGGNEEILIAAAISHDVAWSKVPRSIQVNWISKRDKIKGDRLHLEYAPSIIKKILKKVNYDSIQTKKVIEIVQAHKFQNPKELEKRLLIDADSMSDAFKEQFYSDAKSYGVTPKKLYEFRKQNKFYTKSAKRIFERELESRRKEFQFKN